MRYCTCPGTPGVYCAWCQNIAARAGVALPEQRTGQRKDARTTLQKSQQGLQNCEAPDGMYGWISEAEFLRWVIRLARQHSWVVYHTFDSRRSAEGFPDLVCVRPGQPVLFIELKSAQGELTSQQQIWLSFLERATGIQAHCWRPKDWPTIIIHLTKEV